MRTRNPDDVCRRCGKARWEHDYIGSETYACPGAGRVQVPDEDFAPAEAPAVVPFPGVLPKPAEGGHPGYLKLLDEMRVLHVRKSADYGNEADPLANYTSSRDCGVEPWLAAWVRAKDKIQRIDRFARTRTLANESVEDSLKDAAAHALIALVLYREGAAGPHPEGGAT